MPEQLCQPLNPISCSLCGPRARERSCGCLLEGECAASRRLGWLAPICLAALWRDGCTEQHQKNCLLCMHAVLRLVEDDGLRPVEHLVRDLGIAMCGQAMHEDGMLRGTSHQRFVHLVGLEERRALGRFVLEAHAC